MRCLWAEQVFLDGRALAQVAVDRSRRVTVGQTPGLAAGLGRRDV
jgi:hypothetical protein